MNSCEIIRKSYEITRNHMKFISEHIRDTSSDMPLELEKYRVRLRTEASWRYVREKINSLFTISKNGKLIQVNSRIGVQALQTFLTSDL